MITHAPSTVTLFRANGDPFEYEPVSQRLPKFLEAYPPTAFSVVTEPGPDPSGSVHHLLFRAELRAADGRLVANAHARGPIRSHKDLEMLETAAFQRLLARMGFAGDMLDQDEQQARITPIPEPTDNRIADPPSPAPSESTGTDKPPQVHDVKATQRIMDAMKRQLATVARSRQVMVDLDQLETIEAVRETIQRINRGGS